MRLNINYPGFQDFQDFVITKIFNGQESAVEIVPLPLYDTLLYGQAGPTSLLFFSTGQGAGQTVQNAVAGTASAKTVVDSSQQANGQLPAPQAFFANSIEVDVQPGSVSTAVTWTSQILEAFNATAAATVTAGASDVNKISETGALQFIVNNRVYVQDMPIKQFAPQRRVRVDAAIGTAGTNAQPAEVLVEKAFADGPLYNIAPGIGIQNGVNFNVLLQWPTAVATPSGFNARIICRVNGWLFRAK